ncbi:ATP-dependent DNA ligase [Methyloversatilis sp.]|uniref:ATP-dependent DNA ligase n=1 Tax=Methyloversatilis sp. TaxID=2569862 RepID=UPI0035251535
MPNDPAVPVGERGAQGLAVELRAQRRDGAALRVEVAEPLHRHAIKPVSPGYDDPMQRFAALYLSLDSNTSTRHRVQAMQDYFAQVPAKDAAWAVYFLAGGKPRQAVGTRVLRETGARAAGMPDWLFDECYEAVGDLAETLALILPPPGAVSDLPLHHWVGVLGALRASSPDEKPGQLIEAWQVLGSGERFLFNKLITGALRVGVSRLLVTRALAAFAQVPAELVAQRLIGYLAADPARSGMGAARFAALVAPAGDDETGMQPYPFFLAHPLQTAPAESLGDAADWLAEWKWDGIRAQLVRRDGQVALWSRGEELISERFPELMEAAAALPDGCVLDGEVLAWRGDVPLPFAQLQTRITRKRLTRRLLDDVPAVFMAYDLIEHDGADLRAQPQSARRARLDVLLAGLATPVLRLSPVLRGDWPALAAERVRARERGVEGLMLKRADAPYGIGRTKLDPRGQWWKWKIDPHTIDAVLIYAQRGHGRRAGLYSDYTFAVWSVAADGTRTLVPFAKAYSGLSDTEMREVDAFIRSHTIERFGPVCSVTPELVFELGFEGIQPSPRHKSGIAVRFPRMLRRRLDKPAAEADTIDALRALIGV